MIRVERYVTRPQLQANPSALFVFGDNMRERGLGGQAKEMRGEPNAVGIPTKWAPSNAEIGFFCNSDLAACRGLIGERFAPRIWEYIEIQRAELFALHLASSVTSTEHST